MFEQAYEKFLQEQKAGAAGRRLEMLNLDLTGTKKLLEVVVWPVLRSFDGIVLEYEVLCSSGVTMYIDAFYLPLAAAFECEGFISHAERITRSRFDFEKTRVRTMGAKGMTHMPYSKDQLDKQPDLCRQSMYELLGWYTSIGGSRVMKELSVFEREVIRFGLHLNRPMKLEDVKYCLQCEYRRAHNVIRKLLDKNIIEPASSATQRIHQYRLMPSSKDLIMPRDYM